MPSTRAGASEDRRSLAKLADAESWSLARQLAEGGAGCCDALMERLGSPPPFIVWDPTPEEVASDTLRYLVCWWHDAAGDGLPPTTAVDPLALRPALGSISLLDVLDDGRDFEMRLHGSHISATLGQDMTGMRLGEMAVPFMAFLMVTYRAQLLRPQPLLLRYTPPMRDFLSAWWRIGLPLTRDGKVARLMIGMDRASRQDEP